MNPEPPVISIFDIVHHLYFIFVILNRSLCFCDVNYNLFVPVL